MSITILGAKKRRRTCLEMPTYVTHGRWFIFLECRLGLQDCHVLVLGFHLALRRVWGLFWNWDVEFGVKVTSIETSSKAKAGSLDELHFWVPTPMSL